MATKWRSLQNGHSKSFPSLFEVKFAPTNARLVVVKDRRGVLERERGGGRRSAWLKGAFTNYVNQILSILDHLPTRCWNLLRNLLKCVSENLHTVDICRTTYLSNSSCQRSLWTPSNDGALGERTEEKHCSKGRKEEMLNVVDSIWIEAWPDFSSLFLLVGQGRFMYHLLSLREREAITVLKFDWFQLTKYNNQITFLAWTCFFWLFFAIVWH